MKQKIKYIINNYGIFIISLLVCFILYRFANPIIVKVFNSQNIDKLFQSTITCISIILGFSGTLITQIILSKREMDKSNPQGHNARNNIFHWFFKNTDHNRITSTVFISIISCIILIVFSLVMLITDAFDVSVKLILFYIWLCAVIIFFYYIIRLYHLFITLLFSSEENQLSANESENELDIQNCMDAINNQSKHDK